MIEALLQSSTNTTISLSTAILYVLVAAGLGFLISLTYMKTGRVSSNFARTLIVLPVLVCVVMMAVNGNFGTSLAVVGAFSLVRFRSLQGSSRDIAFIFFAMAIGIVCAIGQLPLALIITLIVCLIQILLSVTNYAQHKSVAKDLRVTIPENLDYSTIFDDLFDKYTSSHKQIAVKTTNMGSMYEIQYSVELLDETKEKSFLDEIRMRNGNLTVVCGRVDRNVLEEL